MSLLIHQLRVRQILTQISGARHRKRRRPRPGEPRAARVRYTQDLVAIAREAAEIVRRMLFPALERISASARATRPDSRTDAVGDDIDQVFGNVKVEFSRRFTPSRARDMAGRHAKAIDVFNLDDQNKQFKAVLGIDLPSTPAIAPHLATFVRDNVKLIQSIPDTLLSQVEDVVSRNVRKGARAEEMEAEIAERFGVSESKATLIARDQTNKLSGELTQIRQTSVGVKKYTWRTSGDERVRPEHAALEGKLISWDDPPAVGHPGEDYNCRCSAEADLEGLLDGLGLGEEKDDAADLTPEQVAFTSFDDAGVATLLDAAIVGNLDHRSPTIRLTIGQKIALVLDWSDGLTGDFQVLVGPDPGQLADVSSLAKPPIPAVRDASGKARLVIEPGPLTPFLSVAYRNSAGRGRVAARARML